VWAPTWLAPPTLNVEDDNSQEMKDYSFTFDFRFRHRSEQYLTSSQQSAHFLRQVKDKLQTVQILVGRSDFDLCRCMLVLE
jgi:hypothetical protein